MKKTKNQIVFKRHRFWFKFYVPIVGLIALFVHYRPVNKMKIKKGEQYLILSNHQTKLDGLLIMLSFKGPVYAVTSDSFFSKGFAAKMFSYQLGLIPKKKGVVDLKANMDMMRCFKEGGSLLIYPEGNRTYAEFQFPFTDGFAKFARFFKKPIVLFNSCGGTGVDPRFSAKRRKGPYYGEIKRILSYEEYKDMSDDELQKIIEDNLRVYDSESGSKYKSKTRAEYLERMFFVCPKCGAIECLHSEAEFLTCTKCGLKVEYTEDLHLSSSDSSFKFTRLVDWYNFQKKFVREFIPSDKEIFHDENVKLFVSHAGAKRRMISNGSVSLYADKICFGKTSIPISEIEIASPINGTNFNFSTLNEDYLVMGHERFNPLKYVLMFNKLDTKMKKNKSDIYYTLEE